MPEVLTPEELVERLNAAGPRLEQALRRRAKVLALNGASHATQNATERMRQRTGHLRRSIAGRSVATEKGLSVELIAGGRTGGDDVVYARSQDQGATIRPTRAKWLAIPDASVQTGGGVPRFPSPRNYPQPLRFKLVRGGSGPNALAILVERVGGKDVARWWLKKQTTIRANYFMRDAWRTTSGEVNSVFADAIRVAMRAEREVA